ncbi:hypothetical protein A3A60_00760 [Candidatus Curtissbacteria bacterium RIFCSPLOWO2_01_FULL_42_26]|uniref:Pseudouridine synthase RsuA/RluA-like domain-containing protein n=1 Tax=Candidatus Curtissbacteria bacterium RIFCSPLOWO2_01_FULL_42_26 TaxID=1797729 RepID=A0A1F5HY27_9BACT|nr:MAG: hypothetical protein A3A60_00760 [Candidatus Curtissbacteria bacterium RIFCSPLOWO2_01_FULL_42_26]
MKIIFENDQFLVIDKPSGLIVNRSETIQEETLQDQISKYLNLGNNNLGIGDRAGIVHRLDKETSGLLVIAKTETSFENLQNQFVQRQVKKKYLALVHGKVAKDHGSIEVSLQRVGKFGKFGVLKNRQTGGRESTTEYDLIKQLRFDDRQFERLLLKNISKSRINYLNVNAHDYSFLKVLPKTGRTHQIRVVLKHIGHPIVSDLIYAPNKLLKFDLAWCPRLFLHAARLEFRDSGSGKIVSFESRLPNDLKNAMLNLLETRN